MTKQEAALVRDLILLYEQSWQDGPCKRNCECARCMAVEVCGNHEAKTFDDLHKLIEDVTKCNA